MRKTTSLLVVSIATLCAGLIAASSIGAPAAHSGKPKGKPKAQCSVEAEGSLSGKRSFELEAELEDGELEGELEFRDKQAKLDFESTSISELWLSGKLATVQGRGKAKGSPTLQFSATLDAKANTFTLMLGNGYKAAGGLVGKDDDDEIELEGSCPFDGATTAVLDPARAVSATVGPDGGSIVAGPLTLSIPAAALTSPTKITVTPITGLAGSPIASTIGGARLEPDGLTFITPATLSFELPAGVATTGIVGFGFDAAGANFHLVPHRVSGRTLSATVSHFSGSGFVAPTPAELSQVLGYLPTPGQADAEQAIVAAENNPNLTPAQLDAAIAAALQRWWRQKVTTGFLSVNSLEFFELAVGEWLAWLSFVQHYGVEAQLQGEQNHALQQAKLNAQALAQDHLDKCDGTGNVLTPFALVLRLMQTLTLWDPPIEQGGALPKVADLPHACMHVEISNVDHAAVLARNRDNSFEVDAAVRFRNNAVNTTIPLVAGLTDTTSGGPVSLVPSSMSNGHLQATIRPGQTDTLHVELKVAFAAPDPSLRTVAATQTLHLPVRDRLELHARRDADPGFAEIIGPINLGDTVTLRARLAGDNTAAVPIAFFHDSAGSVAAAATTSGSGEAFVTYTTSTSGIELVSATVDDNGVIVSDAVLITAQSPVVVSVSPTSATLSPGGTRQFTAAVTGAADTDVTWSATGGTIDQTGLYTADSTSGSFSVTATSVADPGSSDSATVTITAPQPNPVRILERVSSVSANVHVVQTSTGTPPGDEDLVTTLGPCCREASASRQGLDVEVFGSRSASSTSTQSSQVDPNPPLSLLFIEHKGDVTASASAEKPAFGASARGNTRTTVTFEISGVSVGFDMSGRGATFGDGTTYQVRLRRLNADGSQTTVFDSKLGDAQLSGTLTPGRYEFHAVADASIGAPPNGTASAAVEATLLLTR